MTHLVAPVSLAEQTQRLRGGQVSLADEIERSIARIDEINPLIRAILPDPRQRERLATAARELEWYMVETATHAERYFAHFHASALFD